jgi:hypothetical protein
MQRMSERGEHRLVEGLFIVGWARIVKASQKAAGGSDTPAPAAWTLRTTLLSARVTTRTKPSSPFTT